MQENGEMAVTSSMTDLMISLAVIFILLLVASLNNAQQEGAQTRSEILAKLRKKLEVELKDFKDQGFEVKSDPRDPLGLIVIVPEGLLNFAVDKSVIPQEGEEFLQSIMPKISSTLCSPEFRNDLDSIVVEGHTDSTGTDARNIVLSQERSMKVVLSSLDVLGNQSQSDRRCFLDLVSATGRGSVDPVTDASGTEDKDRSRRVVFKIKLRSLEQRTIKELIGPHASISETR